MGVDVCLTLSVGSRLHDVANAIGILAGLPVTSDSGFYQLRGVTTRTTPIPEAPEIVILGRLIDGESAHSVMFHYENAGGCPQMIPPSTAFWIAVCRRLVDFFGGSLDYQDCDSVSVNYRKPCPRKRNDPSDGKPWHAFQAALYSLKPLTTADLDKAKKWAAYK